MVNHWYGQWSNSAGDSSCVSYFSICFRIWRGIRMVGYFHRHKHIIAFFLVATCCVIYYYLDPTQYMIMPKCPVKLLTTLYCPGCGFQRALHATLHGRFVEAIHYNLFLAVAIPLTLLWWLLNRTLHTIRRQELKKKLIHVNRFIIYIYIFCYFAWFVIRNIQ